MLMSDSERRRVLITTVPFGEVDPRPLELLRAAGIAYAINPLGRRLTEHELAGMIGDYTAVIAGTEPLSDCVMAAGRRLQLITRVGIGLDNVDLRAARMRGIAVTYTPDAPAPAVAELTLGLMINLLRGVAAADRDLRRGTWHRIMGRRLSECVVGVIGCGRVGTRVIRHLRGAFPEVRILANDIAPDRGSPDLASVEWTTKERIYDRADVITLHLPLTSATHRLIDAAALARMKSDAVLVNTSRGNMIVEADLAGALRRREIGGAAIDVFGCEPYQGELCELDHCLLTTHMGSMARDCRSRMELEATQEVIRFFNAEPLHSVVPESEHGLLESCS
jgi:D-3-phosphoglycerate dehydrogenase